MAIPGARRRQASNQSVFKGDASEGRHCDCVGEKCDRDELERMLSFHLAPKSDFLEPTNDSQGSADVLPQGQIIGNYKILQLIDHRILRS